MSNLYQNVSFQGDCKHEKSSLLFQNEIQKGKKFFSILMPLFIFFIAVCFTQQLEAQQRFTPPFFENFDEGEWNLGTEPTTTPWYVVDKYLGNLRNGDEVWRVGSAAREGNTGKGAYAAYYKNGEYIYGPHYTEGSKVTHLVAGLTLDKEQYYRISYSYKIQSVNRLGNASDLRVYLLPEEHELHGALPDERFRVGRICQNSVAESGGWTVDQFVVKPPEKASSSNFKLVFSWNVVSGYNIDVPIVIDNIWMEPEDISHLPFLDMLFFSANSNESERPVIEFLYAPHYASEGEQKRIKTEKIYVPEADPRIRIFSEELIVPQAPAIWESEFQWMVFDMPLIGRAMEHYVYPFVSFKNIAARNKFVYGTENPGVKPTTGNAGALPWSNINKEDIHEEVSGIFRDDDYRFSGPYGRFLFKIKSFPSDDSTFMVMEEMKWMENAIRIKAEIEKPFELSDFDESYFKIPEVEAAFVNGEDVNYDKAVLRNQIHVTYTNAAPYPVVFDAYQPVINGSPSLIVFSDLELVLDEDNCSPEIRDGINYFGSYDHNGIRNWSSGRYFPILLLPGEQKSLTWGFSIQHKEMRTEQNGKETATEPSKTPKAQAERGLFTIASPVVIRTTTGAKLFDHNGELVPQSMTAVQSVLPGYSEDMFSVEGIFPTSINNEQSDKSIYLVLRNANLLGDIRIVKGESDTVDVLPEHIVPDPETPGTYILKIGSYVGSTIGNYKLLIGKKESAEPSKSPKGKITEIPFNTSSNVAVFNANDMVKRLVVGQTYYGTFKVGSTTPSGIAADKILLDIGGYITKTGDNDWEIEGGATINGVLALKNGKTFLRATDEFVILTAAPTTEIHFRTEKGHDFRLADDGGFSISLYKSQEYQNTAPKPDLDGEYPEEYPCPRLEFKDSQTFALLGTLPIAECTGVYVLKNSLAIGGNISLSSLSPGMACFLEAELNVPDIRIAPSGLKGFRANVHTFVGGQDPLGLVKAGVDLDIVANTLPELTVDKSFKIMGEVSLGPVGGAYGEIGFTPMLNIGGYDIWMWDEFYAKVNAPIPLGPQPVVQITALGMGVKGMSSMYRYIQDAAESTLGSKDRMENVIPPISAKGTFGLGLVNDLVGFEGTGQIGLNEIGLVDGTLQILMMVNILQNVHGSLKIQDLGPDKRWEFTKNGNSIPMVKISGSLGAELNLFEIFVATAEGTLAIDPGNCKGDEMQQMLTTLAGMNGVVTADRIKKLKVANAYATDIIFKMVDFDLTATGKLQLPPKLGLGNLSISGEGNINKQNISAKGSFKIKVGFYIGKKFIGLNKTATASVTYWFYEKKSDWDVGIKAPGRKIAGEPMRSKMFEQTMADGTNLYFNSSSFIPMVKDVEVNPSKAFTEEWSNTKTQTLQNISTTFSVAVRSKSNQTGIRLSRVDADTIEAYRVVGEDIEWTAVDGEDYYTAMVALEIPEDVAAEYGISLAGEWKVEAYNADATAFDPDGLIDCDFFYLIDPPAIETLDYAYDVAGDVSWTNQYLLDDESYRIRFALVNVDDSTLIYPVAATEEWDGSAPLDAFNIPQELLENKESLPSGTYYLQATLERNDGFITLVDSVEDQEYHVAWLPLSHALSSSFSHLNPAAPQDIVSNISATAQNGNLTLSWDAPLNMNNISGYQVHVIDQDGIASIVALTDSTSVTLGGNNGEWVYNYDLMESEYVPAIIEYDSTYSYAVTPYHENPETEAQIAGTKVVSAPVIINKPIRPNIYSIVRRDIQTDDYTVLSNWTGSSGATPSTILDYPLFATNHHELQLSIANRPISDFELLISDKFKADSNEVVEMNYERDISSIAAITSANYQLNIPLDGMEEGEYRLSCKLKTVSGDYNIYNLRLIIDNTSPELLVGSRSQTEEGEWLVTGVTEAGATLTFNDKLIEHNGSFSVQVDNAAPSLSFKAVDIAGNISTLDVLLSGIPQLPIGDLTAFVNITFDEIQIRQGGTFAAKATVLRDGNIISLDTLGAEEAAKIRWSVIQGNAVSINETTGVITALNEGTSYIRATYLDVLKDVALVTVAKDFPVNDIYVSSREDNSNAKTRKATESVTLTFTQPEDAVSVHLEYANEIEEGLVPENAWKQTGGTSGISASFNNNGKVDIQGLNPDLTYYFSIVVNGGLHAGRSLTTGKLGRISSMQTYTVTFNTDGGDSIDAQVVESGQTAVRPQTDPIKDGFTFADWYADAPLTTLFDFSGLITQDTTIYAKWIIDTEIEDSIEDFGVTFFPNPAHDFVTFEGLQSGDHISITDFSGRTRIEIIASSDSETLSVKQLPKGVYFVQIIRNQLIHTEKLIVN